MSDEIARAIVVIRGHRVLLDEDLASLYGVTTKALLQAVRRNRERFPDDFVLELTDAEWGALRSQSVTLETGRGKHRKYRPFAFTEQGVAMLSSVLRSPRAIAVNVQIMRAFVRMRQLLSSNQELATRLNELEARLDKTLILRACRLNPRPQTVHRAFRAPGETERRGNIRGDVPAVACVSIETVQRTDKEP